jgi:hypothetical protein
MQVVPVMPVCRIGRPFALALAIFSTCSTVVRMAMADGAAFPVGCACGGPSAPSNNYCYEVCPSIIEGDCSGGVVGAKCGAGNVGECWSGSPNCRPDAEASSTDAGAGLLYCQMYENCAGDDASGGCKLGAGDTRTNRQVGLPAVLMVSGIVLLAIDRRHRRRHRH